MTASELVAAERNAMLDLMETVGGEAPTLCEGWTVTDLAAHMLVRERRLDSSPGLVVGGPFARWTERVRLGAAQQGIDSLISALRSGPPIWWRGPVAKANVGEHFIHHEDVRRANGQTASRDLDTELEGFLWGWLGLATRMAGRRITQIRLELRTPDGRTRGRGKGTEVVVLTGSVGDLVLWFSGRKQAAHVDIEGSPAAVDIVRAAELGI